MNYLLLYFGKHPEYLDKCLKNILKVDSESEIYLCSDVYTKYKNVNTVHSKDIISSQTKDIISKNIYQNTNYEKNKLWELALLRIFYLRDMAHKLNLKNIIHFDSDVLTYINSKNLEQYFEIEKINITRLKENELSFGYSYFHNSHLLEELCENIFNYLNNFSKKPDWKVEPKNEMQILGEICNEQPDMFNILKSYPSKSDEIIFDPAMYGQIVGGTHSKPRRYLPMNFYKYGETDNRKKNFPRGGWLDKNHFDSDKFYNNNGKIIFKNKKPILKNNLGEFKIANLHIHSKELFKYV
tara:strand:- start:568 stop:1458 length:891 start_codon:yes stop_codon:yes gene_type:complete